MSKRKWSEIARRVVIAQAVDSVAAGPESVGASSSEQVGNQKQERESGAFCEMPGGVIPRA
ncbi:MAG: hypothetical protein ACKPEY_09955, partial [Planctomycetota bacterium]